MRHVPLAWSAMMPSPDDVERTSPEDDPEGEDVEFEIGFYEAILKKLPESVDVLMALGNDYTRHGLFEKGMWIDQRLCQLRPGDPVVRYNLACSCSLLGRPDDALDALEEAVHLGYANFAYMQEDPDLQNLRGDPRYLRLLERVPGQELTS